MNRVRTAIFISGRGSNMEALLKAAAAPDYPAVIALVLSNNPDAPGLTIAEAAGIPTLAVDHRPFGKDRAAHEAAIEAALSERTIALIALAGYMRILTEAFTRSWSGRMINIHPSLLPLYPGLHTHARALAAGDREAGCTVHLVTAGVDEGPILGQRRVPILPGDSEETLAARILDQEHALYPECLARFARSLGTSVATPPP